MEISARIASALLEDSYWLNSYFCLLPPGKQYIRWKAGGVVKGRNVTVSSENVLGRIHFVRLCGLSSANPLKPKFINNIWRFSPYPKENTKPVHYKDQLVKAV
jgi:hypothetical protein